MFEHRDPSGGRYKTYQVDASEFELHEGDLVQPGTAIGMDIDTNDPIYSAYWGFVATVYYNAMNHSYLVMIGQQRGHESMLHAGSRVRAITTAR